MINKCIHTLIIPGTYQVLLNKKNKKINSLSLNNPTFIDDGNLGT